MLFPEEDAPVVKTWIVKRLETTSSTDNDVDADVLADYVLALLRHDGGPDSVKQLCKTELHDFLKDEAAPFVDDVFRAITYKTYRPSTRAPPPSQPHSLPHAPGLPLSGSAPSFVPGYAAPGPPGVAQPYGYGHGMGALPPAPAGSHPHAESRKRSYHDTDLYAAQPDAPDAQPTAGRATKQARRGGSYQGGSGGLPDAPASALSAPSAYPSAGSAFAPLPEEILRMQQQLGLSPAMFGMPSFGAPANQSKASRKHKKRRCRIQERDGTCTKPNCQFDHGEFAGMADPFMGLFPFFPPMPPMFDPLLQQQQQQQPQPFGAKRSRNAGKSHLAADGPVYDQTQTTIVVQGIPDEYLATEAVEQFFMQFGRIEHVGLEVPRKLALVKFSTWDEANAAYNSPKVVFDNRFVKVFWLRDEAARGGHGHGHGDGDGDGDDGAPPLDLKEFQRKQDEAQRAYEEKLRKKQELDERREELGERMRELFARQAKERQKLVALMAMAAAKNVSSKNRQGSEADSDGNTPAAAKQAAITQTDLIRAQLAALEDEARMLGLDPDAILGGEAGEALESTAAGITEPPPYMRGSRGRGGSYRGGARGGRGGSSSYTPGKNAAAYAAYSLDNRPRRVAVAGADFSVPAHDEALRNFLLGIGDFAALDTTQDAATITFCDRRTAEQFYYGVPRAPTEGGSQNKKPLSESSRQLPGVAMPVVLRWVANTADMATGSGTAAGQNGTKSKGIDAFTINAVDDEDDDNDDNSSHDYKREDGEIDDDDNGNNSGRRQNMDFDVDGEEGWDIA